MQDTILRSEAWQIIDSGVTFDIGIILADRRRGIAGEYRDLKGMQKVQLPAGTGPGPAKQQRPATELRKDPNHGLHKTINIHHPRKMKMHIYKVHYRLFDRFNGKTVLQ